ncbi:Integrase/recombinase [Flavobacterium indicum GPTSA100-9 = DSM 17447]|uniref:Integrase/recombinase n=1 Tax=Flavobacterium indicum (strain DSM 17447 / CIP 109464 / GPTSA100-9) TaxID=1094466 RepID=H8XST5_FLAIG|nr:tyrosine-type recombinase/integrase [Flavobacterium indicum]CCG53477.1 Integrase/recombinase [Flavobacterium indicum GPTSA100-9 = DSM 17447]
MGAPSKHKIYTEYYQTEAINYKKHLDILGLNPETTQARYLYLKEFFSWLENVKIFEIEKVTPKEIANYNNYLKEKISQRTKQKLKQKSIHDNMRNLQQYLGYLLELGSIKSSPASHLKFTPINEKVERFIFNQNQIQELYKIANLEEKAILNIGYGCGLRVQEMSDLNKEDIRFSENLVIVQKGKNSKRRLVPISDKIKTELEEFIFSNENKRNEVFLHSKGQRMQSGTLNKRLKKLIHKAKLNIDETQLNTIGIHNLRHSIATHLLQNGMKLEQVQKFLGHSHIETTEMYTHVSADQIKNVVREHQKESEATKKHSEQSTEIYTHITQNQLNELVKRVES